MKKVLLYILGFLILITAGIVIYLNNSNNFKRDGSFEISINQKPIKIHRDENGIAYVIAENKADLYRGQAFVLAQDRLFQVEFYRALIKGEASALVGSSMLDSDIKMRVLNLSGNAKKSYQYLDDETKEVLQWYCEGFNEYLKVAKDEFPIELSLLGIEPKPFTPEEVISVTHFVGLFHSQNLEDEVLSLNLASQMENANELLPISINIDRTKPLNFTADSLSIAFSKENLKKFQKQSNPLFSYPKLGSNNWAISGEKSASGKPILSNDPHIDARILPGLFYPIGLFCPEFKGVGIATPGIPGLICGRNEFVSFGVTNAYGDSQDLFIEKADADFYRENNKKIPFEKRKEIIKIKDSIAVEIEIRQTKRGPVISDFSVFNILTDDVVSLRWSLAETKSNSIGLDRLLATKNVAEFKTSLKGMDNMFFNYAIADIDGNIAHQATGLVPIRANKSGAVPLKVDGTDNWKGFIPKDSLPNMINPERGWIGTANHDTRPDNYPYYYSSHFSPFYRYQRITEILSEDKKFTKEQLWKHIFDVKNKQAEALNPIFTMALHQNEETKDIAKILQNWNLNDGVNEVGASIYNVLYNELLYLILNDELPDELEDMYWENVYYWNQKVDGFITSENKFIDNINTSKKETLNDLIIEAGIKTKQLLEERLGSNQNDWTWGKLHKVKFVNPIRTKGFGTDLLGAEEFEKAGSNQTLNRGAFIKNTEKEFETSWFSSFRMVADMGDSEKIMGVVSGGSSARSFHPYLKSQLATWQNNDWIPYWISKEKVEEHAQFTLVLE